MFIYFDILTDRKCHKKYELSYFFDISPSGKKKVRKKKRFFNAKNWTIVEIMTGKKNNVSKS